MLEQKCILMVCSSDLNTILSNTKTLGTHLESKFILGSHAASISCSLLLKLLFLPELSSSMLLLITAKLKLLERFREMYFFPVQETYVIWVRATAGLEATTRSLRRPLSHISVGKESLSLRECS